MAPRLVLVLCADQLNAGHTGFGGLGLGHTPHLDRLAAGGLRFDRAHAANPICMPSRATMATGVWPSTHGTRTNGVPLDPAATTIQGSLRRQGWNTAAVGKLHYQTMGWDFEEAQQAEIDRTDPEVTDRSMGDGAVRDGRLATWDWERMDLHDVPTPLTDYYGFADVDIVLNHGDGASGHYRHWARRQGFDPVELAGHARSSAPSSLWSQVWRSEMPAVASTSAFVVEHACRRIEQAAASNAPTYLFVSFPDPHHPFCPPVGYDDRFDPAQLALPSTFDATHVDLPPHLDHIQRRRGVPHEDTTFTWAANEEQHREAMSAQLGLIAMLDDGVGAILEAVSAAGLADDTLTLFTADHGELGGEHGLWLKHYNHYPALTRIPLVISGDGIDTGSTEALVSNADLVPTLIALTDTERWRGIQGRSLGPIARGSTTTGRQAVLVEEDQPIGIDGLNAPVRMRTIVTDEARLTIYHGESFGELYDHRVDPDELVNLFDTEPELRTEMTAMLLDEVLAQSDQRRGVVHAA